MAKKSLIGAFALAGLALAGKAYAQDQKPVEPAQYSQSKDIAYTNEQIDLLISKYKGYIAEIAKEKRGPNYSKSLEKLSKAASDGVLYPFELLDIDVGTYMIIKKGLDKAKGEYSVPILVRLGDGKALDRTQDFILLSNPIYNLSLMQKTSIDALASGGNVTSRKAVDAIAGIKNIITYLNRQKIKNEVPTKSEVCEKPKVFYDEIDGKKIFLDYAGAPTKDDEISKAIKRDIHKKQYSEPQDSIVKTEEPAKEKKEGKTLWSLIFGGSSNAKFDEFVTSAGIMAYPFEDKDVGFGVVGEVGFGKKKEINSYEDSLFDNLTAAGTTEATNNYSLGASLEMGMGSVYFGLGMGYDGRIIEDKVELREGNEVIKSNSDSSPEKERYAKAYAGWQTLKGKGFNMGIFAGYKWQGPDSKPIFGVRNNIKLGSRK
jgi:hypothetical protein